MKNSQHYAPVEPYLTYDAERRLLADILPKNDRLHVIDPFAIFCEASNCRYRDAKDLFFFDAGHLSQHGVEVVLDSLDLELATSQ
ncbi:SGNH hydrolase domain-containing protein [Hoeflea ulvae]|uniref:SGNH hydrolase domain-containing protein n=1 Tax=Hoeflea ulvae TaxID=2983764 RepID=A0ABT3YFP1_9HYPH|nr:SGNH hydrolase domain-containing protein [Hoeflea ulvae]MCY0094715.1 SGNH hydrolase domain-containing protein [Hoeflea ulvae]